MSRAVTASQLPSDIAAQIESRLQSDPSVIPAQVRPGVVPGTEPRKKGKDKGGKIQVAKESPKVPDPTDVALAREREEREAAFLKVAEGKIDEVERVSDQLSREIGPQRTPRRGLLLDEPEDGEEEEEKPERGQDGKFKAREDVEESEEDAGEAAEDAPEADEDDDDAEPAAQTGKPSKMTHEKALALLRLDGFKSKALEKLSPEEAIELATHRASVRSGVEKMASELAALKKGGNAATKTAGAPDNATATPATSVSDFDVKQVTKRFRETYGEKEAETVEEPISALAAYMQKKIDEKAQSFEPIVQAVQSLQVQLIRNRLERVSPELGDDAVWGRVMKQAAKCDPTAYGGDIAAIIQDAQAVVMARLKKGAPSDAHRAARLRGQPATSSRRETPLPMSRHDAFGALAVAIEEGNTEEVERIRRSM